MKGVSGQETPFNYRKLQHFDMVMVNDQATAMFFVMESLDNAKRLQREDLAGYLKKVQTRAWV